jgi:acyl-CoA oxidase
LLSKVCDLYALSAIEAHKGWYLEHQRLTPPRSKAVTGMVNDLLRQLRPKMAELVDAFAIPAEWLACAALREEPGRQEVMADHDLLTASAEPVTTAR